MSVQSAFSSQLCVPCAHSFTDTTTTMYARIKWRRIHQRLWSPLFTTENLSSNHPHPSDQGRNLIFVARIDATWL